MHGWCHRSEESVEYLELKLRIDGCDVPCGYWTPNPGPPQEQQVLLTGEPALALRFKSFSSDSGTMIVKACGTCCSRLSIFPSTGSTVLESGSQARLRLCILFRLPLEHQVFPTLVSLSSSWNSSHLGMSMIIFLLITLNYHLFRES